MGNRNWRRGEIRPTPPSLRGRKRSSYHSLPQVCFTYYFILFNYLLAFTLSVIDHCLSSRTLGNIVTGNDEQTQCVLESGALEGMSKLIMVSFIY